MRASYPTLNPEPRAPNLRWRRREAEAIGDGMEEAPVVPRCAVRAVHQAEPRVPRAFHA